MNFKSIAGMGMAGVGIFFMIFSNDNNTKPTGTVGRNQYTEIYDGSSSQPAGVASTGNASRGTGEIIQNSPPGTHGGNLTATFNTIEDRNGHADMARGTIVVNGNAYEFNSGGYGRGYLPPGSYEVSNLHQVNQSGMVADRGQSTEFGYKAIISDSYDERVGDTRELLRIHPDEGNNGTMGCIGICGGGDVQRQFYSDLQTELERNGGSFTLQVGG